MVRKLFHLLLLSLILCNLVTYNAVPDSVKGRVKRLLIDICKQVACSMIELVVSRP